MQQEPPSPRKTDAYWRRARLLTALLLTAWFVLTFAVIFFARELSGLTLFGWLLPFYMAAQGLPLLYLLIVGMYAKRMRRLDKLIKDDANHVR